MAITLIDGFDLYNGTGANTGLQSKWSLSVLATTAAASMVTGRFGGQAYQFIGGYSATVRTANGAVRSFPGAYSSGCVGFAYRRTAWPVGVADAAASGSDVVLENSGTPHIGITVRSTGSIDVCRLTARVGGATVLGSTAGGVISLNTWHFIEIVYTISDTVGAIEIFVDGTSVISLTGVDTRNGATTTVDSIFIGLPVASTTSSSPKGTIQVDDLYITDTTTRLGERRVETLRPNADTAQKDFTRSAGSDNFALVDDTTCDGDTTYVQGSVVGNLDRYTTAGLSTTPTAIDAVQLTAFALKTDATTRNIALHARSGSTDSDGSNYALAASYTKFDRILETDPATSAAWTSTGVNSLQFGPKVTV